MSAAPSNASRSPWLNVWAFLTYALLAALMTWPLLRHLGTQIAGDGTDVWIHQWTFWWIKQALQNGQNPFHTTLLYYPDGVSLTSHNIAWFNIALWLPLQAFLGSVAAYNLMFILVLAFNGFAFYLLAREETGQVPAAFIGGLIVGFWPYTFSHDDHPNMMAMFWVPLTMYFVLRLFRHQRWRDALFAGLSLAMIGITRWQLLVMSVPVLAAYTIYLFFREEPGRERQTAVLLLAAALLGGLLMAPLAAPLVLDQLGRSGPEAVAAEETDLPLTDLLAYVMPPDLYRAQWDELPDPLPYPQWEPYHTIASSAYHIPFLGLLTLALAFYGLWRQWKQTWFWLLVALGLMLFALGSVLAVNGQQFPQVPMPYRLIEDTLLGVLIRHPHRLNIFLSIPVGMMAAWGMVDLFDRIRARQGNGRAPLYVGLTAVLLGAIILLENPVPPLQTTETAVPQWYRDLAADEDSFAILEIPFHNRGFDKLYMYYQTVHGKPILVGHVSRLPDEALAFLRTIPFLEPLISIYTWNVVEESWVDFDQVDVTRQFRRLAEAGVRYIVLNKPLIAEGFIERWRDWVTYAPIYEDDEVLVYRTNPQGGQEFVLESVLVAGIGPIRAAYAPQQAVQSGVINADVRWGTASEPAHDLQVCFYLVRAGATAATACRELVPGYPTSAWQANEVARGVYRLPVPGDMPPGDYRLEMALAAAGTQTPEGETVPLGDVAILPFAPQNVTALCWEGDLCLRGYDLAQTPAQIDLALYWQAAVSPDQSYKRFVHLVDPADGRVLAQNDAIPRDWTYPTDIWEPDEVVLDRLSLPLDGVEPGAYELRAGWYAVDGEQRLAACPSGDCAAQTADYQVLNEALFVSGP